MNYKKNLLYAALSIIVMTEWGCATRKYDRNMAVDIATAYHRDDSANAAPSQDSSIATIPYHSFFKDVELQQLIEKAISQNIDLKVAIKQIDIASESVAQAKLGNLPTVSGTIGSASIDRSSEKSLNGEMYSQFLGKHYLENYTTSASISWTADIWGKIKAQKEGALDAFLQTDEARKTIQTQIVSQVSQSYYVILLLQEQKKITQETIALLDSTIAMTKAMQEVGEVTALAVQQQEAARKSAIASLPSFDQQIAAQEHSLSILSGEAPHDFQFKGALFSAHLESNLRVGIPVSMVDNRPDVHTAELDILRNLSAEKVAHASMYPQLTISGSGGFNANDFKNWFNLPGALFVNGLSSITTPIFNGRQLKTRYNQSKITTDQSILTFKKTILTALGEVSTSLSDLDNLNRRENGLSDQITELKGAIHNSTMLYESGMSNYLDIISAESNLLQAQLSLAAARQQRLSQMVNLYVALGGGWQ